jgi:hypothetical protein
MADSALDALVGSFCGMNQEMCIGENCIGITSS